MKLSEYLERRLDELCPPKRGRWLRRAWNTLHGTTASVVVSATVAALAIVDCLTKESYLEASQGIRFVIGIVACITAQHLYARRRAAMGNVLRGMLAVARRLEQGTGAVGVGPQTQVAVARRLEQGTGAVGVGPQTQAALERAARRCGRLRLAWRAYSLFVVASVMQPTLTTGRLSMPVWPRPESLPAPRLALAVTFAAQVVTGCCCPIAYYTLVALMVVSQVACAALYRATGATMEAAHGHAALVECARLHALLSDTAARLNALTADSMVMLLFAGLLLPIIGTYEVVKGRIDAYLLSSFPIVLVVFVPLCFGGQGLSDASEEVGLRAYSAEWLAEGARARTVRALIMLRASKPAQITCRGLGELGLPACESVLKSWFSYLQMLLNLANGSGPHRRGHRP